MTEPSELNQKTATVRQLCMAFLRYQAGLVETGARDALNPRTLDNYRQSLENRMIPEFGEMKLKQFKSTHAAQYLFKGRETRSVAANRDFAALMAAFNHGMALGLVESNPCRGVRRNREHPRKRPVSIAEVNSLMQVAEEMGGGYLMVALIGLMVALTGRRRGEILELQAENLTAEGILAADHKTARHGERHYLIEWSPLLREMVERSKALRPEQSAEGWLFPSRFGRPYTDSGFKSNWNRLIRVYEKKHGERFRAHDLRSLYVSEMLERGESPNTHSNEATMRKVYDRRKVIKVTPLA